MLAIDVVKPAPVNNLEAFERWCNRMQSELLTTPYAKRTKIEVRQPDANIRMAMPTDDELLAAPTLEEEL